MEDRDLICLMATIIYSGHPTADLEGAIDRAKLILIKVSLGKKDS